MKTNSILNHGVQKVLDLLDLTFADFVELHGTLFWMNYQIYLGLSKYLDGNSDKHHFLSFKQGRKISGFYGNIPNISMNPSHTNSETKKV